MTPPKKSNLYGILFMLSTCLIITLSSILIKNLGKQINPFEVVFIRCAFTVLITVTFNYRMGKILYVSEKPALLSIRSVFTACVVLGNFYAISHLPLVEVTALQFSKPLFLIVLAAIFLGETIKFRRTVATIIGFIGIVVVVHPWDNVSSESLSGAHLAVLGAAFSMAVIAIMSKVLTKDHHPTTLVFYANSMTVLICLLPTIYFWVTPTFTEMILIAALGTTTFCAQYCMISSYKYGELTIVTPFEYFRIIFAAVAGYFIFSELPDIWTIIGGSIICVSTLFIAYREIQKSRLARRLLSPE